MQLFKRLLHLQIGMSEKRSNLSSSSFSALLVLVGHYPLENSHVDKKPEKKEHNFLTFRGEKEKKGKVKAIIFKLGTRLRGNL